MNTKNFSLPISNVLAVIILLSCVTKTVPSEAAFLCSRILLSQKEIRAQAFDFKKEFERIEIRYGGKLKIQAVPSKTSLKYIYLLDSGTGERVAELNYRHLGPEQKLVVVWSEARRHNIGLEEALLGIAIKKHPDVKVISTNSLGDKNEIRIRQSIADGLSLEEAIRATPTFQMRSQLGFDQIVPESVNAHFGFDVRKRQDNHGKFIEIQDPVGPVGLTELRRQLDWPWQDVLEQTAAAQDVVISQYERRQFTWQKEASPERLVEAIQSGAKNEPQVDAAMVVGSNRLRHEADRVSPGVWTVALGKEGHWHFYSASGNGSKNPRAAWLVEQVREALDFKLLAESRYGSLNGVAGTFMRSVEGGTLADYKGHIDIETVHQMLAFDFLVQHKDAHFNNFKVNKKAELQGLDYESAFELSTASSRPIETPFGSVLPPTYNGGFIARLKAFTPEQALARWDKKMTSQEIEAFLILREIILNDAFNKGF